MKPFGFGSIEFPKVNPNLGRFQVPKSRIVDFYLTIQVRGQP